jgi:uncharacterized protein YdaU (DUF1376 family)
MAGKVRRVDFYPDEYIAGVGNVLRADEQGIYWMICALITSEGGPIARNELRIASLCLSRQSDVRRIIDKLIAMGKVSLTDDGKLVQKRAQTEIEASSKRIQTATENGSKGGRPSKKDVIDQQMSKPDGLSAAKLTTNYQLPTTNQEKKEDTSLRSVSTPPAPKPRATRLTDEWILPKSYGDWALEKGLPRERILVEADKMKNWSINAGKVGAKLDWFAAWRNWVQKAIDDMPQQRGFPIGGRRMTRAEELQEDLRRRIADEQQGTSGARGGDLEALEQFPGLLVEHHAGRR